MAENINSVASMGVDIVMEQGDLLKKLMEVLQKGQKTLNDNDLEVNLGVDDKKLLEDLKKVMSQMENLVKSSMSDINKTTNIDIKWEKELLEVKKTLEDLRGKFGLVGDTVTSLVTNVSLLTNELSRLNSIGDGATKANEAMEKLSKSTKAASEAAKEGVDPASIEEETAKLERQKLAYTELRDLITAYKAVKRKGLKSDDPTESASYDRSAGEAYLKIQEKIVQIHSEGLSNKRSDSSINKQLIQSEADIAAAYEVKNKKIKETNELLKEGNLIENGKQGLSKENLKRANSLSNLNPFINNMAVLDEQVGSPDKINAYGKAVNSAKEKLKQLTTAIEIMKKADDNTFDKAANDVAVYREELKKLQKEVKSSAYDKTNSAGTVIAQDAKIDDSVVNSHLMQVAKNLNEGTIASHQFDAANNTLKATLKGQDDVLRQVTLQYDSMTGATRKAYGAEKEYVSLAHQWSSAFKAKIGQILQYVGAIGLVSAATQGLRNGLKIVRDLDDAMTEMKKVTDETAASFANFQKQSIATSKQVGSTASDLMNSAADWSKVGYNLKDSMELAKNTALYMNVADITNIDSATQHLTSTLMAYNLTANDSLLVVDKFNAISNNFSITADGLGEGLERAAAALVAAGNSLDESMSLITVGNIISQNPESVATAIKTTSLRIRGAKAELQQMGEEFDNVATSTANLRKEIMALSGVDIMLDADTFKSTYDIISELGKVWDRLTDMDQATILEDLAGKNNASVVAGLIANYKELEAVKETSLNAAGSAMQENETYLDSMAGRVELLQAQLQELWANFYNSDVLKDIISLGTGVISLANDVGLLNVAFVTLGGVLASKNINAKDMFDAIAKSVKGTTKEVTVLDDTIAKGIIDKFNDSNRSAEAFAESMEGLDNGMKAYLKTQKNGEATTAGYIAYTKSMGKAFDVAKLKAFALNAALNAMTMIGIGLFIQGVVGIYNYFAQAQERAAQAAKEVTDAFNESQTALRQNKTTIDSIKGDYARLSKGVDDLGRNVSLTAEEYEQYHKIVNQIAEMFPTMTKGYDDEGNAIIELKGNVNALTEAYKEQAEAANLALIAGSKDVWKNFQNNTKGAIKDVKQLKELLAMNDSNTNDRDRWQAQADAGNLLKEAGLDTAFKNSKEISDMIQSDYGQQLISSYIRELNTGIETEIANVKSIVGAYIDLNDSLTPEQKSTLKSLAIGLSNEFYSQFETNSQAFDWINKNLINSLKGENALEVTRLINSLFTLDPEKYRGSYEEYVAYVQDLVQKIQDYLNLDENTLLDLKIKVGLSSDSEVVGEELISKIRNKFLSGEGSPKEVLGAGGYDSFKQQQKEISDWIKSLKKEDLEILYSITPRRGYTVADYEKLIARAKQKAEAASPITIKTEFSDSNSATNKAIDKFQEKIGTLKTALDKLRSGNLSKNEILDLIQEVPELSTHVNDLETGINLLMTSAKDDAIKALDNAISNAVTQEDIDNFNAIKATIEGISDEAATIDLTNALANLEANGDLVRKIKSDMKDYGYVATETLQKIIDQYPKLESAVNAYLQGKKTEKDLLKSLSKAYEADFDNYQQLYIQKNKLNVDFYNEVVKNLDKKVKEAARTYDIDFINYKNTAEAKLRLERAMAQKVAQLRRAQAQADADVAAASVSTGSDQLDEKNQMIAMESYKAAIIAKQAVEGLQSVIDGFNTSLDEVSAPVLSNYSGLKGQDKKKKGKDKKKKEFSKTFDWVEIRIQRIQESVKKAVDATAKYITSKSKNLQLNTAIGAKKDEKELLQDAKKRYEQEAKNVGLSKKYRELVDNGGLKIETIKDEKLAKKIENYKKWTDAAKGVGDRIKAINDEIKELSKQKLDNIDAYWDSKNSTTEARVNKKQSSIDLKIAKGRNVDKSDYQYLINRQNTLLENAQKRYDEYQAEMNAQIKDGTMKVGSEDWKNATAYLINLDAEINNTKIEVEGLNDSIRKLPITLLDNKLTQLDNARNKIENRIAEKEAKGGSASTKDYKDLISNSNSTIDTLKEKNNELIAQQKTFLKEGGQKTDQGYIDLETQIQANANAISACRVEQAGWNADMRGISWRWLDKGVAKLNDLRDQLDTLSNLVSGDLLDDKGNYTNAGITQLGLYAQQLSLAEDETRLYQKAINQLKQDLATGRVTQEQYNEELANYTSLQNQAALKTKEYKDAIIDLKKEAINAQTDAFRELIDARKEDLAAQKKSNDFAKSMRKSQDEIDTIQKKINALKDSKDRKSIAQRLELEKQLAEKQEQMSEKQADHDYDTKVQGLDDEMKAFEKIQKDKIKELNNSLSAQEAAIKESLGIVQNNYSTVYGTLNTLATDYGINLSESITSPWESAINAAELYKRIVEGIGAGNGVIGDFGGTVNSTNKTTAKKAKVQAIISNGQGQGEGTSELNEYIKSMGYEQISYAQMAELAKALGVKGVTEKSIKKDTAKKKEILEALKKAGFSKGGIVGDIKDVIKGNGDTGIATVHKGEGLVPVESTPAIKELVANTPILNKAIGELTNLKYIQPTAPSVTLNYEQLIRVDGSVDKSLDIEGVVKAGIDKEHADLMRILKQYK